MSGKVRIIPTSVPRRRLAAGASAALALAGVLFMGEGIWIKAKAELAQILLERAFSETIVTRQPVKPWRWADTWPVARISVPRLKASAIALESGSGQAMAFGPGHLVESARAGERGTAVFAAHRDTHFAFLKDVKDGDEILVTRDDGLTFTYIATGAEVVRFDQSGITANSQGRYLALATCWPFDGKVRGPLRYVVHAKLKEARLFAALGKGRSY
jgi:sortase A